MRHPSKLTAGGGLDLFLVRGNRALAIEVKGDGDTVKAAQADWLSALRLAGVEAMVVDVPAWETGIVEKVLA
jgi:VRR-NUC domain-containing protein